MSELRKLPPKMGAFVVQDDVLATVSPPDIRDARQFSMVVAEEALQQMGPRAIEYITQRLADSIQHEEAETIRRAVHAFLHDRAWAEPIIREAIRDAVREIIGDMLAGHKDGQS